MGSVCVIGVGNILFLDEGIGVFASSFIKANYLFSPNIDIIDGGTLGFHLLTYFQNYDKVIIVDVVSIKDKAGSVYNLPKSALLGLGKYKSTAHEVEVTHLLEVSELLDKSSEVNIVGIVPQDITKMQIGLTKVLKDSFYGLVDEVLLEIKRSNVKVKKNKLSSLKNISEVINSY